MIDQIIAFNKTFVEQVSGIANPLQRGNPEFTVAFATTETMVASDYVGIVSGRNTPDKMEKTGWTIEKAPNVNAPVFKEFPMTLECRVKQKIDESETG